MRGTTRYPHFLYPSLDISIHVPRAGYDRVILLHPIRLGYFYPRTPCGVRPGEAAHVCERCPISIHVPRAGYDMVLHGQLLMKKDFYPRTPCGVRLIAFKLDSGGSFISIHVPRAGYDIVTVKRATVTIIFLSTYPVRGTTG